MIPILYRADETSFTSNGICRLSDCGMCLVTEERNGVFECQFTYPVNGLHYADIKEGRIIFATHDETGRGQPFDIYARTEPINGVVTFFAHHVSYRLGRVILSPFTAGSCSGALAAMPNNTYNSITPFTFWTDKTTSGNFKIAVPTCVKEALGGSTGSILDVFGKGEYEWDRFEVKLHQNRGVDTDITIRYGVNMTGYNRDLDYLNAYGAVVPYWANSEDGTVVTPGVVYASGYDSSNADPVVMDLSAEFDTQPTTQQVATKASQKMANNRTWLPKDNIEISFAQLWQTEEYAQFAPLQRLRLCDRVNVVYGPGNVTITGVQIIKTIWDVLLDRYDSMELGSARTSFEQMLKADITEGILDVVPDKSYMDRAISAATDALVKGGYGSYVVFNTDSNGNPNEILIMDDPDIAQAVNVWRWNEGGLGFSSNGYNGPFTTAITEDGKIVADFVATGELNAAVIKAGVLSDQDGYNSWDLESGDITLESGSINIGNGNFVVDNTGAMSCKGAKIEGVVKSYGPGNVNLLKIEEGKIKGDSGQSIEIIGGLMSSNAITIDVAEIDLLLTYLYVQQPSDRTMWKGITYEFRIYLPAQILTLKFVHGILVDYEWTSY